MRAPSSRWRASSTARDGRPGHDARERHHAVRPRQDAGPGVRDGVPGGDGFRNYFWAERGQARRQRAPARHGARARRGGGQREEELLADAERVPIPARDGAMAELGARLAAEDGLAAAATRRCASASHTSTQTATTKTCEAARRGRRRRLGRGRRARAAPRRPGLLLGGARRVHAVDLRRGVGAGGEARLDAAFEATLLAAAVLALQQRAARPRLPLVRRRRRLAGDATLWIVAAIASACRGTCAALPIDVEARPLHAQGRQGVPRARAAAEEARGGYRFPHTYASVHRRQLAPRRVHTAFLVGKEAQRSGLHAMRRYARRAPRRPGGAGRRRRCGSLGEHGRRRRVELAVRVRPAGPAIGAAPARRAWRRGRRGVAWAPAERRLAASKATRSPPPFPELREPAAARRGLRLRRRGVNNTRRPRSSHMPGAPADRRGGSSTDRQLPDAAASQRAAEERAAEHHSRNAAAPHHQSGRLGPRA